MIQVPATPPRARLTRTAKPQAASETQGHVRSRSREHHVTARDRARGLVLGVEATSVGRVHVVHDRLGPTPHWHMITWHTRLQGTGIKETEGRNWGYLGNHSHPILSAACTLSLRRTRPAASEVVVTFKFPLCDEQLTLQGIGRMTFTEADGGWGSEAACLKSTNEACHDGLSVCGRTMLHKQLPTTISLPMSQEVYAGEGADSEF
eukprot:304001-Rhodomonas_salina.1